MMPLFRGGVAMASLFLALPALSAENEALQQLERMSQAAHSLNYEGSFVYLHSGHVQSVRIVHGVDAKGEHERLITLSGRPHEVVRDNDEVRCFLPDDRTLQVERGGHNNQVPMFKPPQVEQISNIYQLALEGHDRVAGRDTVHVAVIPRDNYRYGRGYWIDDATGVLLRTDLIDDRGHVVEKMMFTSIQILDTIPSKSLVPENSAKDFVVLSLGASESQPSNPEAAHWEAESLPPGFSLELMRHLTMPGKSGLVEHHVFRDGLASVSVFIEPPGGGEQQFIGHSRMGAVNAFARLTGQSRIVVVGEVPAVTVERIAGAMRPRAEEQKP
ncbi:MAG TPA: MucB/RseB C-terminal domain-containing protein [Gammaproteobacteria bacterium]